jgi:RimJ/RimL family protein N-acetyltransferase
VDLASGEIAGKIEASVDRETRDSYLGYFVFRPFWQKGYGKEACMTVIEHLFQEWRVPKVTIEMDTRNTASIRLAESLGARRVGIRPKAEFFKGSWSDEYVYELNSKN